MNLLHYHYQKITEMVWMYTVSGTHVVAVAFVALVPPDTTANRLIAQLQRKVTVRTHLLTLIYIIISNAMLITQALML